MPTSLALLLKRLLASGDQPVAAEQPQEEASAQPSGLVADYTSGANRLRETAKWLIAAFAAVGTILVAGSQLSDLGSIQDGRRLLVAFGAAAVALAGVVLAIGATATVLTPVETVLSAIAEDERYRAFVERHPDVLRRYARNLPKFLKLQEQAWNHYLSTSKAAADHPEDPVRKQSWEQARRSYADLGVVALEITAQGYFHVVRRRFKVAMRWTLTGAFLTGFAVTAFAWASHPPPEPAAKVVFPVPSAVTVHLTDAGRRELAPLLGDRCVGRPEFRALAIDGNDPQLEVVTSPRIQLGCRPARFVLTPARGNAAPIR